MTAITSSALELDSETILARPRRHSCALLGQNIRRQIKRTGIERSMFCSIERAWLIPLQDLPAFIRQADKDHRVVIFDAGAFLPGVEELEATPQIPLAHVVRVDVGRTTRTVVIRCPYCSELHSHGWPYQWADVGIRVAHCGGPDRTAGREYRVVGAEHLEHARRTA